MTWLPGLFFKGRSAHFLVMALAITLLLIPALGISTFLSEAALNTVYFPFFHVKNTINDLASVHEENQKLRQALVDASIRVTLLEEAGRENIRLRSILGFEPPSGYTLLPAKVMAVTGNKLPVSAIVNRGEMDGVRLNEPIINEEGLLGRVSSLTETHCTIQLLTDPTNRVAVRVAESREMGIAKFLPSQGMIVDNIPSQGDVKQGDLILSSGLGGVYPPGLVVGTVIAVERSKQEPFLIVRLAPSADFNSLDELFVLRAKGR
jgi:rod shape-determining protein MreC